MSTHDGFPGCVGVLTKEGVDGACLVHMSHVLRGGSSGCAPMGLHLSDVCDCQPWEGSFRIPILGGDHCAHCVCWPQCAHCVCWSSVHTVCVGQCAQCVFLWLIFRAKAVVTKYLDGVLFVT